MSKPRSKVVRTQSTPLLIPGKKKIAAVRKTSVGTSTKSILKNSLASSPASEAGFSPVGTPDFGSSEPKRKTSQVRFSEGNIESPDYYIYNKTRSGQVIISPMAVFRKISLEKEYSTRTRDADSDSVKCLEGSDDDDEDYDDDLEIERADDDTVRSNSPPLRLSSSMSNEAQYAILKAYEDEMYDKIAETFPQVSERLEFNRCQTPDIKTHHYHSDSNEITLELDDLDDNVSNVSVCTDPYKVAQRIQKAMDILDSVRETNGELITSSRCGNRTVAKNPVKSFEKWSRSLKDALTKVEELKV